MKKIRLLGIVNLVILCVSPCYSKEPLDILGTWVIYKCEQTGIKSLAVQDICNEENGKEIVFHRDYFECRKDTPFAKKGKHLVKKYEWKIRRYNLENGYIMNDGYDKGTLAYYGMNDAYESKTIMLVVSYGKGWREYFEVTKNGKLATLVGEQFYFLKKKH